MEQNYNIFDANKTYFDKKEKIYYQFKKWDTDIYSKNIYISKEYFLEIFNNSKIYFKLLENSDIYKFDNNFMKILISILKDKLFNINDYNNEINESLVQILLNLILSYYFRNNDNEGRETENNIIFTIDKIIKPILEKNIKEKNQTQKIIELINEILFTKDNLYAVFSQNPFNEEVINKMYSLIDTIIINNSQEYNIKLFKNLYNIINDNYEEKLISFYIVKIIFYMLKNKLISKMTLEEAENLFINLFHSLCVEKNIDNLKYMTEILKYLIQEYDILKEKQVADIKFIINFDSVISLFDIDVEFLSLLIKKLQFNDSEFSDIFNNNYIMKLYTHCEKIDTKDKKIKFKLLKFIIGLLDLIDKYTYNRIFTLMGYPTLIFKGLLNFGVSLMDNNIRTEIFEYTNNNHIRKERCILAQLFPSKYLLNDENFNVYLEENDRLDLIYELIKLCFGLKGKKNGNYFLFKFLYLTQTRSINYENLYQEMKLILENSEKKKYNLAQFNSRETNLIEIVKYEKENLDYKIINFKQVINTIKPELPELLEECKDFMNETINVDYYGTILDMVPFQTQKILIDLIASSDNLSLFRFEYFTNYFTKKELLSFDNEKKIFPLSS